MKAHNARMMADWADHLLGSFGARLRKYAAPHACTGRILCRALTQSLVSAVQDLMKIDPDRARDVRVTLVEAMQVLGSFDARLREYAARTLHRQGIHLVHGMVKEVREKEVELRSGDVMPYGLCVWSTGVGAPRPRSRSLSAQLLPEIKCPRHAWISGVCTCPSHL